MEPIIIRTKPDAKLAAIIALAATGGILIVLQIWIGIALVLLATLFGYLLIRQGVLVYDAAVIVREYLGSTKYRWSRIAGFGTMTGESGNTIGVMHLLNGEDVPLPIWADPDPTVVQRLDAEARRRQAEL